MMTRKFINIFIAVFFGFSFYPVYANIQYTGVSINPSAALYYENIFPLNIKSKALLWGVESSNYIIWKNYHFELSPALYMLGSYTVNEYAIDMQKRRQLFFQLSGLLRFFHWQELSFSGGPMYMLTGRHYYDGEPEPYSAYSDVYLKLKATYKKNLGPKTFMDVSVSTGINLTPGREVLRYIYEYLSTITSINTGIGYRF